MKHKSSPVKELLKRHEAINHIEHFGRNDPNFLIHEYWKNVGNRERAKSFLAYRKNWEAVRKGEKQLHFPLHVNLGLNDSCNLACAHCYRSFNKDRSSQKNLPLAEVKKIIAECKEIGVPSIGIGTESEPLLHKNIVEIIKYAGSLNFDDLWLYSNGQLLSEKIIDLILSAGVTRLLISLDAISPENYAKVRGANFYGTMSNVFRFLEKREKRHTRLPVMRVSFVRYHLTDHEADRFVAFWKEIADEVDVQPLIDVKNVDRLKFSTVENPKCNYPETMLYVKWNGDYKPCCSEFCKHLTIGNRKTMTVSEAWNSAFMKNLRSQFLGEIPVNRFCVNCLRSLKSEEKYKPLREK